MENSSQQKAIKKENKNFLIGVVAISLIALYSTNPTQQEFNEFISNYIRTNIISLSKQKFSSNVIDKVIYLD